MSKSSSNWDFFAKIVILGEAGSGKTSIWQRYFSGDFSSDYTCTLGADWKVKTIEVDGKRGKFEIWDTAGQERFRAVVRVYLRGSAGVILDYAINDRESFEKVGYWMEEVRKDTSEKDRFIVLVGSKSDLTGERVVSFDEGRELAESYGVHFFEVSAKENLNVEEVFLTLATGIYEARFKKKLDSQETGTPLKLSKYNSKTETNCFKCS